MMTFVTCPQCGRVMVDQITPHKDWRGNDCVPTASLTDRVFAWLDHLDNISPEGYTFTCDTPGKRFVRIVMSIHGKHNSVHAFYDMRTGDVLKAAGWKAPAKGVRFNLRDDESFARMMQVADWSGGYLYIR